MTAPKFSYLYARVSSTKQDTYSQLPALMKWKDENDPNAILMEDVGTGKTFDRPNMTKLIELISKNCVKKVVVVSINRLGRNVTEAMKFVDLCDEHKVPIVSIREGTLDLSTPFGRALAAILLAFAQLENEQRSEATKAGIAAARERASKEGRSFKTGGSPKGWSFKVTQETHDAIIALVQAKHSYRAIAETLHISDKTVANVAKNPRAEILTRKDIAERNKA